MKCEWCNKETTEEIFCSQECASAWKRNDIMLELQMDGEE